ncbi:hypothetical protein QG37_04367 [Candidozyma auris]|nr:hypothetical protein QG37_04367 [[Candida] auris]
MSLTMGNFRASQKGSKSQYKTQKKNASTETNLKNTLTPPKHRNSRFWRESTEAVWSWGSVVHGFSGCKIQQATSYKRKLNISAEQHLLYI